MLWLVKIITGFFLDKSIRGIDGSCACAVLRLSRAEGTRGRENRGRSSSVLSTQRQMFSCLEHTHRSRERPRIVQLPTPRYNSTVKNNGALDSVVYACAAAGILPVLFYLLRAIGGHMFLNSVKQLI
jgi:hypothetical protein